MTNFPAPAFALRFVALCLGLVLAFASVAPARADGHVYSARSGAAVDGYDVVSYFTKGAAERGTPDHAVIWKGVVWQFSSDVHREMFESDPRAYAPRYGGFCAYGVAKGQVLETDPTVWRIHDGKLYLIHNTQVWSIWAADVAGHVAAADDKWPTLVLPARAKARR